MSVPVAPSPRASRHLRAARGSNSQMRPAPPPAGASATTPRAPPASARVIAGGAEGISPPLFASARGARGSAAGYSRFLVSEAIKGAIKGTVAGLAQRTATDDSVTVQRMVRLATTPSPEAVPAERAGTPGEKRASTPNDAPPPRDPAIRPESGTAAAALMEVSWTGAWADDLPPGHAGAFGDESMATFRDSDSDSDSEDEAGNRAERSAANSADKTYRLDPSFFPDNTFAPMHRPPTPQNGRLGLVGVSPRDHSKSSVQVQFPCGAQQRLSQAEAGAARRRRRKSAEAKVQKARYEQAGQASTSALVLPMVHSPRPPRYM